MIQFSRFLYAAVNFISPFRTLRPLSLSPESISFIEDREVIKAILKHLRLWLLKSRPTPKAHAPPAGYLRDPFSQLSMNDDHLYGDPDYPWDAYLQS